MMLVPLITAKFRGKDMQRNIVLNCCSRSSNINFNFPFYKLHTNKAKVKVYLLEKGIISNGIKTFTFWQCS